MCLIIDLLLGATVVVGPVPAVPVESEVGPGVVASVVDPVVLGPAVVVSLNGFEKLLFEHLRFTNMFPTYTFKQEVRRLIYC